MKKKDELDQIRLLTEEDSSVPYRDRSRENAELASAHFQPAPAPKRRSQWLRAAACLFLCVAVGTGIYFLVRPGNEDLYMNTGYSESGLSLSELEARTGAVLTLGEADRAEASVYYLDEGHETAVYAVVNVETPAFRCTVTLVLLPEYLETVPQHEFFEELPASNGGIRYEQRGTNTFLSADTAQGLAWARLPLAPDGAVAWLRTLLGGTPA